ncbi:hypothetical protein JCM15765_39920 [Paradesulfitobacterium aromaticivorans]
MESVVTYALDNDMIFLALFILTVGGLVWLVRWILRTNDDREKRYITVIDEQAKNFSVVKEIKESVERIERRMEKH